jgi:hypothetical protein
MYPQPSDYLLKKTAIAVLINIPLSSDPFPGEVNISPAGTGAPDILA